MEPEVRDASEAAGDPTTATSTTVGQNISALSDSASSISRRSSSRASLASSDSRKAKTLRSKKKVSKNGTVSGTRTGSTPRVTTPEDSSLTSFPSLSPEPEEQQRQRQRQEQLQNTLEQIAKPLRTESQRIKARKATLAGLTNPGILDRSNALFDDSPRSSLDIPGSLHLANDDHIKRLIEKVGPLKLVRQYAQDLAQRDAEISALRVRADERERELKRMLREADVSSADIEKRLLRVDRPVISTAPVSISASTIATSTDTKSKRTSVVSIDTMMSEAMSEPRSLDPLPRGRDREYEAASLSGLPAPPATLTRRLKSTASVSQLHENVLSRNSSRASSTSRHADDRAPDSTIKARQTSSGPSSRVAGLQSIFQPPSTATNNNSTSYFIGGSNKSLAKAKAADEVSVKSTQSAKSSSSWTRIFGGRSNNRSRASSIDQNPTPKYDESGLASAKLRSTMDKSSASGGTVKSRPQAQRSITAGRTSQPASHHRKDSMSTNKLPPTVELDSMIESSQLPPTMANYSADGLLVDRFGFIYDRKRKRQYSRAHKHAKSKSESLGSFRTGEITPPGDQSKRPATPASIDEDAPKKSWQDYLLPAAAANTGTRRPRELLSHSPSAGAVVTVNTADVTGTITPPRNRNTSNPATSLIQKSSATASLSDAQSAGVVGSTETSNDLDEGAAEVGATKALLDQLTELHDNLQNERTVKWNDFLRRVRAERSTAAAERSDNNVPEADLVNGELIGIATLGRSNKTKAKYMHFKGLVLAGIPVSLRPKVWAECSGASMLRVPGYYEDLVARSKDDSEIDAEIAQQITADVRRTLRDNIFFREPDAPGVQRLAELLRAYSLHNPQIGYCQGMNLITASLLLICATSEDCFWLLVSIIDYILPSGYFDQSLLVARADQLVLRAYVAEILPRLDAKLTELGVELEACTFHWFLSLYTGVLTGGEALYRVWDVVLCLNSSDSAPNALQARSAAATLGVEGYLSVVQPATPTSPAMPADGIKSSTTDQEHDGTSSPFLFQLSLALLKLNEEAIIALDSPAQIYTYLNHNMTAHNITIDALVNASEMLRSRIKRSDVLDRRKKAIESLQ